MKSWAPNPVAITKLFTPDSSWTWFVLAYDPEERLAFGLVDGAVAELGYFSITELDSVRGPWGLPIERDICFNPTPLSELKVNDPEWSWTIEEEKEEGQFMMNKNGCSVCDKGKENFREYKSPVTKKYYIQYDYRTPEGKLFTCVKPTLEKCREARDNWLHGKSEM